MTVTEKELFLAILAMDSYNRGAGASINNNGSDDPDGLDDSLGTQIGSATISVASSSDPNSAEVSAGFYAVAYNTQDGTFISYRGTDATPAGDLNDDAHHGWTLGGGNFFATQTALSINFLDAVQADNAPGSIIRSDSSLSGGLACIQARLFLPGH